MEEETGYYIQVNKKKNITSIQDSKLKQTNANVIRNTSHAIHTKQLNAAYFFLSLSLSNLSGKWAHAIQAATTTQLVNTLPGIKGSKKRKKKKGKRLEEDWTKGVVICAGKLQLSGCLSFGKAGGMASHPFGQTEGSSTFLPSTPIAVMWDSLKPSEHWLFLFLKKKEKKSKLKGNESKP